MEHLSTLSQVVFKADHIYRHHLFCVNYTTYDIHRAQDTINPQTDVSQSEGLGRKNNHNQHNKGLRKGEWWCASAVPEGKSLMGKGMLLHQRDDADADRGHS